MATLKTEGRRESPLLFVINFTPPTILTIPKSFFMKQVPTRSNNTITVHANHVIISCTSEQNVVHSKKPISVVFQ